MRPRALLMVCAGLLTLAACKRAPASGGEPDVAALLRQALAVPLPESARLPEGPEGPLTEDGTRLDYGVLPMTADDQKVQPFIATYLQSYESDPEVAMAQLDQALELVPGHEDTLTLQAMALMRSGDREGALARLQQVLDQHERPQAPTFIAMGSLLAPTDIDAALAANQQGLDLWPGHPRLLSTRGTLMLLADRPQEAVPPLEQAYRSSPEDPFVRLALGHAYAKTGHHVFAMHMAESSYWMSNDPDHRRACADLVRESWANNLQIRDGNVGASLVPTSGSAASADVLSDPNATWDVRYETAAVLTAAGIGESVQSDPVAELDRLARLRAMTTRVAVASGPELPVHPIAAWHVRADLDGCAVGYQAVVLGVQDRTVERWLETHPQEARALAGCLDNGLLGEGEPYDISRVSWGIGLR